MDKPAYFDAFNEFVKGIPRDQRINHSEWDTCAVGLFKKQAGLGIGTREILSVTPTKGFKDSLFDLVGNGGNEEFSIETFGELADVLQLYSCN